MNQFPRHAAFIAGLAVVAWVGAGYVLTNPLALAITLLIGALYVAGVLELRRFRGATDALARAIDELPGMDAATAATAATAPRSAHDATPAISLRAFLSRV